MKSTIATPQSKIDVSEYGGKAFWLAWLHQNGYNIARSIFIPAVTLEESDQLLSDKTFIASLRSMLLTFSSNNVYDVFIRSSATVEDAALQSYAGHFKSINGIMNLNEMLTTIREVIDSIKVYDASARSKMGVIVQKTIDPIFSGVAFSSNPLNGSKVESLLSIVQGFGASLVSGEKSGEDIVAKYDDCEFQIPHYKSIIDKSILQSILSSAKSIENHLSYPVDIEWCVEEGTNQLYILQCRPITALLSHDPLILPISIENQPLLPDLVKHNEKVTLRLVGYKTNVMVSPASIVTVSCSTFPPNLPDLSAIQPSRFCKGYSLVLIHPRTLSGKVRRSFIGPEISSNEFLNICRRYCIRSFPEYTSLNQAVSSIANLVFPEYWQAIMILQEIFDPEFSGIVRRIDDGYLIELAKGHFVPKGVVPTSQYVVDFNGSISFSQETNQFNQYKIINGFVLREEIKSDRALVSASHDLLRQIVTEFHNFLESSVTAIEFGVLKHDSGFTPYLIDLVEDKSDLRLETRDISEGIMSKGIITGKLIMMTAQQTNEDTLNFHFHDSLASGAALSDPTIILCEKPDISLLNLIQNYDPNKLGFIFRSGSVLCHLAIILRERSIPALVIPDLNDLPTNTIVTIDATSPGRDRRERVIINGK